MGQVFQSTVNLPWHYAIVMLILVTPLVTLFFLLIGLGVSSRKVVKGRDILFILLLIWFIIPWGKYALAAFINHRIPIWNGIRHFLEVAVPLSIIAGIGAAFLFDRLYQWLDNFESLKKKNTAKNIALILIFLLAISPTIVAMAKIHPYQTSYYNSILGGPKGVYDKNVWARIDYWGAPYRQGAEWLNQNAYKGSTLFFTDTSMYERIASFYVSKDFQVVNNVSQSNYLVTQYPFPGANPIHTIDALGAPILLVYRVQ